MAKVTLSALVLVTMATLSETGAPVGFIYASEKDVAALVKAGHAEVNKDIIDAAGNFAVRATQAGIDAHNAQVAKEQAKANGFEIESNVEIPEFRRPGNAKKAGSSKYPFDALGLKESFFVANSEKTPDAYKSMASSVTAANVRHSEVIEGETRIGRGGKEVPATRQLREFKAARMSRTVVVDGVETQVEGCRIFRIL